MDAAEAARVRDFENGPQMPLPLGQGLAALFTARAQSCPDALAIQDASGSWTYRDLSAHANGVAQALVKAGVRPGDLVVLAMERSIEAIAALLGIVMAGAGYVPLDPGYPEERKCLIAADAGARVAIADVDGRAALASIAGITVLDSADLSEHTAEHPPVIDWRGDPDDSPAYLMYTSGST
jgi:non-ribosomal peptide synthetase component F